MWKLWYSCVCAHALGQSRSHFCASKWRLPEAKLRRCLKELKYKALHLLHNVLWQFWTCTEGIQRERVEVLGRAQRVEGGPINDAAEVTGFLNDGSLIRLYSVKQSRCFSLKFSITTAQLFPERGHRSMVTSWGLHCASLRCFFVREGMFPRFLKVRQCAQGAVDTSYEVLIRKQQWRCPSSLKLLAAFQQGQSGEVKLSPPSSLHHPPSSPPPLPNAQRATTDSWNMSPRSQVTIAPSILKINLAWEMSYSIIHCVIFACKLILIQCDKEN